MQATVVRQLVRDFVTLLAGSRAASDQPFTSRGRACEGNESVLDLDQCAVVRKPILLECDRILLELRDCLIELRFLLNDGQREVRVAELDERLASLHAIAGFDEHTIDAPAI